MLPLLCVACCVAAVTAANPALAACKTPLPDASLRALDASADIDPVRAVTQARALLDSTPRSAALRRAQLYAIVADAYDTTSDDAGARQAVVDGRAALAQLSSDPLTEGVALRLALVEADTSQTPEEIGLAVRSLHEWERRIEPTSLGHACLLLVRGRVVGRLAQFELAAKDGLRAYALATELNATDARSEAAFQLGTTFRRAGLYPQALEMVAEVVSYTRRNAQTASLASALWLKGTILLEAGRPAEALSALEESRALSLRIDDATSLAFTDLTRCQALHRLGRNAAAEAACRTAEAGFRAADRGDQLPGVFHELGALALERGDARAALIHVDAALAPGDAKLPALYVPSMYEARARALRQLGRTAEALEMLQKATELHRRADESRESLAVAVLSAQQQTQRSEVERQALARQLQLERERAREQRLQQRLFAWLGVGGAVVALLLGYLLVISRRYARELRRQEAILRATSDNAPDALVLLDGAGRTLFANRALFRGGAPPAPARLLADGVPPEARAAIESAVDDLIARRRPVALDISVPAVEGPRHYEVRGTPIVEGDQLIGATLRSSDVTDRRTLEREVLEIAARERQRFSTDLHEGLGQDLTGIALQLQAFAYSLQRGKPDAGERVADAIAQVSRAIATTRDLARGLSPVQIERGSLSLALHRLAADAERRLRLTITSASQPPEIQAPEEVSDHLYRIAYEALTNAARHGRCQTISLDLVEDEASYVLTVTDDGRGLPPDVEHSEGLGLRMIAYRARLVGGAVRFDSTEGRGTRVIVTVPRVRRPRS